MSDLPVSIGKPLVSVIMNCYNGEKYLRKAVESVLAQTYENWEIIFWDNGSMDRSADIITSYAEPRIRYFHAAQRALLYEARNYAIEKANGDFIAFLDVDDWWLPHKLEKQVPHFSDPEVGLVCGNFWIESERKQKRWKSRRRVPATGWVLEELLKSYFVGLVTLIVRRSALASLDHPCDPRYHMIGDFDLVVRLSMRWKLEYIQDPVACYRVHENNESAKKHDLHIDEMERWLSEMREDENFRHNGNIRLVQSQLTYLRGMQRALSGDRRGAYQRLRELAWGRRKLQLFLAMIPPTSVLRKARN